MSETRLTVKTLDALRALDTPTVCNRLELLIPNRRGWGYTVDPLLGNITLCIEAVAERLPGREVR